MLKPEPDDVIASFFPVSVVKKKKRSLSSAESYGGDRKTQEEVSALVISIFSPLTHFTQ